MGEQSRTLASTLVLPGNLLGEPTRDAGSYLQSRSVVDGMRGSGREGMKVVGSAAVIAMELRRRLIKFGSLE
jgi:hypothetical protein